MPEEKDYTGRVYLTLKESIDGFDKSESEFRESLKDTAYARKVYQTLKESIEGFDKSDKAFFSELGKPSPVTQPGGGGGLNSPTTPGMDGGRSPFGMGSIAGQIGQPPKVKKPVPPATMPPSKVGGKKLDFEQRFNKPELNIKNADGSTSTHKMASAEVDGMQIAYPTIVNQNGKLKELSPDEALDYAIKTGEFKEFKTQEEAQMYAEGGYKKGTALDEFGVGSIARNIGSSSTSKPEPQQVETPTITAPQEMDLSGLPPIEQVLGKGDRSSLAPKPQLSVPPEAMEITISGKSVYNPLKDYQRRQDEIDKEDDVDRKTIKKKELWEDVARYSQDDNKEIEGFLKQATPQLEQMVADLDGIGQALQNPELPEDQRMALQMRGEELQGALEANATELQKLEGKYKSNAALSAQLLKASKGLRYNDAAPFEITTKEIWNGTVPAILKSVGGVLEAGGRVPGGMPSLVNPETGEILNPTWIQSIGSAIITGANDMQGEYQSTDADVSVLDDLNASNISKLAGSVLSSFAIAAGSGGLGSASQAVAIGGQVFGNTYEQAKDAGMTPEMAGTFAIVPSLVSAKLAPYGVESIAARLLNPSAKVALKEAIKNVGKEGGAKKALELGKEWAKNVLIEGATGATESAVQYGEEVAAQQLPNVDFGNDETLKGFIRAVEEGFVTEAAGGGALGLFLTARPRTKLSDIASSAIKDPAKEQKFFDDLKSLLDNQDISQEQFDQVTQSYEKAKAAAAQVPPTVTNPQQSARATELIQEQEDLTAQIQQTNPAMVAPLHSKLDEVNAELGDIAIASMADIGQISEPTDAKPKKIKTIAEIVAETKEKAARGERLQAAKAAFKEQQKKGEALRIKKEEDAKAEIKAQRQARDNEVAEIEKIRPDLTDEDMLLATMPPIVEKTIDRMDAQIPTDPTQVQESIDVLDNKFDELEAYKKDPKRTHTIEQIDEVIDLLGEAKTELQLYQEQLAGYERETSTPATEPASQGKPEIEATQTPTPAEQVAVAEEVNPEVVEESVVEPVVEQTENKQPETAEKTLDDQKSKNKVSEETLDDQKSKNKVSEETLNEQSNTEQDAEKIEVLTDETVDVPNKTIIAFHATSTGEVKSGKDAGIHIGTEKAAEQVKEGRNLGKGQVVPVSVKINKPLVLSDMPTWSSINLLSQLYNPSEGKYFGFSREQIQQIRDSDLTEKQKQQWVIDALKRKGFDAIAYKNDSEDAGKYSYVIFDEGNIELLNSNDESKTEQVQPVLEGVRDGGNQAEGRQEGQAQEITGLDAIAAEFGKEVEKVVNPTTKADVKAQEEVADIIEDDAVSMPSESEMTDKRKGIEEDFASAMKRVKDSFGDLWSQNLGIIYDQRRDAQKLYNFHSALVNLGRQAIRLGISDVNAFAARLGRRADRFLDRAWKDAELAENGQPMIVNSVDDMLNSEYLKVAETYQKQYDDASKIKKPFIRMILDTLGKALIDANYVAKRMLRDAGAVQAIIDKNLLSGASARAQKQFDKFRDDVFGGLSKKERILLNNVIQSMTIISIDSRFDASGKKRIKHPGDTNKESHEIYLGQIEQDTPELFKKLKDRADKYFECQRLLLKERLDEGRLTIDSYNAMINNDYSPRVFLEYLIDDAESEMVSPLKKGVKNIDISSLSDGDINSLYHNAEWLLSTNTLSTNRVIFHNRANRSLYDFAKSNPNNGLIEIQQPVGVNPQTGQPVYTNPKVGYGQIQFFENGVRKSMIVVNEFANSWNNNNPLIALSFANVIRLGTGGSIKRMLVTGINPAFALANFPRDIAHSLFFTNAYSPVFPVALAQMTKDLIRTAKDAWLVGLDSKPSSKYHKYIDEGGGMDFLSIQGRPFVKKTQTVSKYEKGVDALVATLGYVNNRTEIWVRLAIRDREIAKATASFAKKNGRMPNAKELERMQRNATEKARSQMDFSRGGVLSKALDNFIPYLNAGVQGLSVSASYVKNNPGMFAIKAVQAIAIAAALAAYNMDKYDDDYEKIDEGEKARNSIYMLPITRKTKDGKQQRAYIRIPKNQSSQVIFSFGEILGKIMSNKPLSGKDIDLISKSLEGATPNINPQSIPIVDALYTYQANYDRFLDKEVWRGARGIDAAAEYYEGRTPWLWRDIGESLGASPERLKEAFGKATADPDNNIFYVIAAEGYETLIKGLPEEERTQVNDMAASSLEKILTPIQRKFLSYTNDFGGDENLKKIEAEILTKNKLRNDTVKSFIRKYIKGDESLDVVTKSFKEWVNTQAVDEKDKIELRRKFESGANMKDAESIFYKLINTKLAGVKARIFYDEWVKESKKGNGDDFIRRAKKLKVIPVKERDSDFWNEFSRLKEQK